MLLALLLQATTYLFQGEIWRIVTRAARAPLSIGTAYRLSVGKLFVDQALPSAGISGNILMVKRLEELGVPHSVVMAGVVVDTASCYATYVLGLGAALVITLVHHQASWLVLGASIPFAVFGLGIAVAVLTLSGPRTRTLAERVKRVGPVRRALRLFEGADPRLARRPSLLLSASACQFAILLLDAATIWYSFRHWARAPPPVVCSPAS
jgi:Mg2+-importing ATPase